MPGKHTSLITNSYEVHLLHMQQVRFSSATVDYYYNSPVTLLPQICTNDNIIFITDSNVAAALPGIFAGKTTLVIPAGEESKSLGTIERLCNELLDAEATRQTWLVGVGGGVVSDITGFVAAVYMRGIRCGFVPTTLLAMVDAAIGGKNGVNTGPHKNIIGTIRQPDFLLFDPTLLSSLPDREWSNGFAEVIKYACIFDAELFAELASHDINYYRTNTEALNTLIRTCADLKNKTVAEDEHEKGIRKLLNFGHTAGHAIETTYGLPHGAAVGIGMVIAATMSVEKCGLPHDVPAKMKDLLCRYGLPDSHAIDTDKIMALLKADKKRTQQHIDYILLEQIGKGVICPLTFPEIESALKRHEGNS
jgi:3-dehydroquinate synthase